MRYTLTLCLLSLGLLGCGREDVRTYEIPKTPTREIPSAAVTPTVPAPAAPAGQDFTATLPAGWTEVPGTGMRRISYRIADSAIDFYLIELAMGDVPSNVNRWRGQVGLPPASADEIAAELVSLQAAGRSLAYIEIYNPDSGQGIIAAILDLAPRYWYFTAKGTVEDLRAHAADIRAYLESIELP